MPTKSSGITESDADALPAADDYDLLRIRVRLVECALARSGGDVKQAARRLHVGYSTLRKLLKRG